MHSHLTLSTTLLVPASLALLILASCGKKGDDNAKPTVTTLPVTNITATGATSGCNITNKGGSAITDAGIMWDTTSKFTSPHDSSNYTSALNFNITIPNLPSSSTWYVRAYATNNAGTTYGNTLQFTTDTIPSDYIVTTIAGSGAQGFANGPALSASFFNPLGIAVAPNGVIYVGDGNEVSGSPGPYKGYVRKIATDGTVSALALGFSSTDVVADSAGNVYDFDLGDTIYKITPAGVVSPLASGFPSPLCMDIDNAGNLYVTFFPNSTQRIAKISPSGVVKILPISSTTGFLAIAVDHRNNLIYVSEGPKIERIDTLGNITFIAGGNGTADGTGTGAGFGASVTELRVDKDGNLIAADNAAYAVRMITPAGVVTTIAGNRTPGDQDGAASKSNFTAIVGLALDANGNIFVTDAGTHKIKRISHK